MGLGVGAYLGVQDLGFWFLSLGLGFRIWDYYGVNSLGRSEVLFEYSPNNIAGV